MMLNPIHAAQALRLDISQDPWPLISREAKSAPDGAYCAFTLGADDQLERATRTLAVERWPLYEGEADDGGSDGCPPAATRHILAGCLVASLATGMGFRYGTPPLLVWPLRRLPPHARRPDYDQDYPDAPHYALAEQLLERYCGSADTRDPEDCVSAWRHAGDPVAWHRGAIEFAIALLCDRGRSYAEIVADACATVLAESRDREGHARDEVRAGAARVRRMLRAIAPREVRS